MINKALSVSSFGLAASFALSANVSQAKEPSVLEFGLEDTLFVADTYSGTVAAYELQDVERARRTDEAYNLMNVDGLLEDALKAKPGSIMYHDLTVHPVSRDAYVSVTFSRNGISESAIVSILRDGTVHELDLENVPSSTYVLPQQADSSVSFWRDIPAPTLTVTDLDFVDGELFVSGLSSGEFSSTLRRVSYPFAESSTASKIEMFHAAHNQRETRAPIRAMTVADIDGVATVVAAYTCTPLVTMPVSSLVDGAKVTGKTIAELGFGNTPVEVIAFSAADMDGTVKQYVLVFNREMDADLISFEALSKAIDAPGLSEPVPYLGATAGVETTSLPLSGVIQAADQDNSFVLTMRRNLDTAEMELVSFRKGAFFRLSDFVSEYNFPDYEYADDQQGTRMFQNMLKNDEGYPDETR